MNPTKPIADLSPDAQKVLRFIVGGIWDESRGEIPQSRSDFIDGVIVLLEHGLVQITDDGEGYALKLLPIEVGSIH